jgi:autotransporter-associated beta strand protein
LYASGTVTNPIPTNSTVYIAKAGTLNVAQPQTICNLQDGTGGGGTIAQVFTAGTNVLVVQSGSFSGLIRDSSSVRILGLTKSGSGTLTLSGTNTCTGPTLVAAGTLLFNGMSTGSTVAVSSGATLSGTGRVHGPVTTADTTSHIAPGNSVGTLTVGALDASGGANFVFDLGTSQDHLVVTGAFTGSTADNGLVFDFSNAGNLYTRTPYTLITFGSSSGLDYSDLAANSLPTDLVLDPNFGDVGSGFKINANSLQVQFAGPSGSVFLLR